MRNKILSLLTVTALSGCAYALDSSIQDITILTPGAEDSVCYMYVDGVRYRMHPPQTTSIARNEKDLIIDCLAPGNRRKKVVIEPGYADSAVGNVATAGVGLVWDYASGALFKYPDVVEISFVGTPIGPAFTPAQNNPDIRQPEDYPLEEFRPSSPRINSDSLTAPEKLTRKDVPASAVTGISPDAFSEGGNVSGGKGALQSSINNLGGSLNPSANAGPTPIIPGE